MGHPAHVPAVEPTDRRSSVRWRVNCPVQLQLARGQRIGCLCDLSERGARVQMDNPPKPGTTATLEWMCFDEKCTVIWATETLCGLMFDRDIPPARVFEMQQFGEEYEGPVAEVSNIPLGQKRRRLGA